MIMENEKKITFKSAKTNWFRTHIKANTFNKCCKIISDIFIPYKFYWKNINQISIDQWQTD